MRTRVDDALRAQSEQYAFRFTCEHCVHADEATGSCTLGYPSEPHRGVRLAERDDLEFCKYFELC